MTTLRQAAQAALEAMETNQYTVAELAPHKVVMKFNDAITAMREALAQPEQEPVKMIAYNCTCGKTMKFESVRGVIAPQRTWVGLTDEEIESAISDGFARGLDDGNVSNKTVIKYVRGIEAALRSKNT